MKIKPGIPAGGTAGRFFRCQGNNDLLSRVNIFSGAFNSHNVRTMALILASAASLTLATVLSRCCLSFLLWAILALERAEARPENRIKMRSSPSE